VFGSKVDEDIVLIATRALLEQELVLIAPCENSGDMAIRDHDVLLKQPSGSQPAIGQVVVDVDPAY
jgi:hypothetical protein